MEFNLKNNLPFLQHQKVAQEDQNDLKIQLNQQVRSQEMLQMKIIKTYQSLQQPKNHQVGPKSLEKKVNLTS